MDSYFQNKREKNFNFSKDLEIVLETLCLPEHLKDYYFPESIDQALNQLENSINSSVKDELKFGVHQTRRFLSVNQDKTEYIQELIKRGFVGTFIGILENNKENDITVNYKVIF